MSLHYATRLDGFLRASRGEVIVSQSQKSSPQESRVPGLDTQRLVFTVSILANPASI